MQNLEYLLYYQMRNLSLQQRDGPSERTCCFIKAISHHHVWDTAEIAHLPLKRVFAINDLFQGVLEPFEFFLQGGKKTHFNVFMESPWLTLEIHPQDVVSQPLNKTVTRVTSAGLLSNLDIQNNRK